LPAANSSTASSGIAAEDVAGPRRNEARADIFVYMIHRIVMLEHLLDVRYDFDDPDFAFREVLMIEEGTVP
jgi:hypothetical protein